MTKQTNSALTKAVEVLTGTASTKTVVKNAGKPAKPATPKIDQRTKQNESAALSARADLTKGIADSENKLSVLFTCYAVALDSLFGEDWFNRNKKLMGATLYARVKTERDAFASALMQANPNYGESSARVYWGRVKEASKYYIAPEPKAKGETNSGEGDDNDDAPETGVKTAEQKMATKVSDLKAYLEKHKSECPNNWQGYIVSLTSAIVVFESGIASLK